MMCIFLIWLKRLSSHSYIKFQLLLKNTWNDFDNMLIYIYERYPRNFRSLGSFFIYKTKIIIYYIQDIKYTIYFFCYNLQYKVKIGEIYEKRKIRKKCNIFNCKWFNIYSNSTICINIFSSIFIKNNKWQHNPSIVILYGNQENS